MEEKIRQGWAAEVQFGQAGQVFQVRQSGTADRAAVEGQPPQALYVLEVLQASVPDLSTGHGQVGQLREQVLQARQSSITNRATIEHQSPQTCHVLEVL
jgi:hypothetical protein